jgi:hypothetical protein
MVADLDVMHVRPELNDHAGALVSDHGRQLARSQAFDGRQIGVAEAGGGDLDQHLAGARRRQADLLDPHRLRHRERVRQALLVQHGGGHFHVNGSRILRFLPRMSESESREQDGAKPQAADTNQERGAIIRGVTAKRSLRYPQRGAGIVLVGITDRRVCTVSGHQQALYRNK